MPCAITSTSVHHVQQTLQRIDLSQQLYILLGNNSLLWKFLCYCYVYACDALELVSILATVASRKRILPAAPHSTALEVSVNSSKAFMNHAAQ